MIFIELQCRTKSLKQGIEKQAFTLIE